MSGNPPLRNPMEDTRAPFATTTAPGAAGAPTRAPFAATAPGASTFNATTRAPFAAGAPTQAPFAATRAPFTTTIRSSAPVSSLPPMFATPAPSRNAGKSLSHLGWEISTTKLPICAAPEIDAMTVSLGIAPPEMIFGNNLISLYHQASGWGIKFNSYDALDLVDKTGETMLKVAYSEEWGRSRKEMVDGEKESELGGKVRDVAKKWDWSYSTEYKGTMVGGEGVPKWEKGGELPLELLKRPDPILLFDEVVLYEDELADNGIAILSVKLRVMPERLLLLQRFFLRLDGVVVRVRDTRVYVEFKTGEVIREYVNKEMGYGKLREEFKMYPADEIPSLMRDPNQLVDVMPVIETIRERLVVPS